MAETPSGRDKTKNKSLAGRERYWHDYYKRWQKSGLSLAGYAHSDSLPVEKAEPYGDNLELGGHYGYWLNILPTNAAKSAFKAHAYDYYPRGRIVYNCNQQQAKLYIDPCINKDAIKMIYQHFALPDDTWVGYDSHYQCHRCNPSFIDDFDENYEIDD